MKSNENRLSKDFAKVWNRRQLKHLPVNTNKGNNLECSFEDMSFGVLQFRYGTRLTYYKNCIMKLKLLMKLKLMKLKLVRGWRIAGVENRCLVQTSKYKFISKVEEKNK